MKIKLHFKLLFTFLLFLLTNSGFGQEVIFSENMGERTSTGTLSIANNIFQNTNLVFSGDADVRNNTNSNYSGASGNNNVMINANGENFEISNINTLNYSNIVLSLGQRKGANAANNELLIQVSSDGINYSQLNYSRTTGSGTSNWILINPTGVIPSTQNLRIKFVGTNGTEWRIDDIKLTGILAPTTAPVLTTPQNISGTYGVLLTNYTVENTGGNATSWSTPSLPQGINFANGVFSGTPMFTTQFSTTVTAINSVDDSTATINFNIAKAHQTFGLPTITNKFVDDANVTLPTKTKHLTNSTLEANNITYTSNNTAVVEIVNGNQLDFLSAGTATITATSSNNNLNYEDIDQVSLTVNVNKRNQTITGFNNITQTFGGNISNLNGSVNSNLGLTYEIVSGQPIDVISLTGNQVTILNAGSTKIRAFNAGNNIYNPVEKIIDVTITQANHIVDGTFNNLEGFIGEEFSILPIQTNANVNLEFNTDDESIAFYDSGKIHLVGLGTTSIRVFIEESRNFKEYSSAFSVKVKDPDLISCVNENFSGSNLPDGWNGQNYVFSDLSGWISLNAANGYLITPLLNNPRNLNFDLRRTNNSNDKTLYVEGDINTSFTNPILLGTYDHSNTESNGTTNITINITNQNIKHIRFRKQSSTTSPWRIDNVKIDCGTYDPTLEPLTVPAVRPASKVSDNKFQTNWKNVNNTGYLLDVYRKEIGDYLPDLIISEYVEGTSQNKALEIYNGTGNPVNLNDYKIKKQTNGDGPYLNPYSFPLNKTLNHGETFVIVHGASEYILPELIALADDTDVKALGFNGNDAIVLEKNDVIVDQVGVLNQVTPFWGKDITLRRKPTASPNPIYNLSEWDSYPQNTFNGLGQHTTNVIGGIKKVYVIKDYLLDQNVNNYNLFNGIEKFEDYYYTVRGVLDQEVSDYSEEMDVKRTYYENGSWTAERNPEEVYHLVVLNGEYNDLLLGKSITIDNGIVNTITSGNTYWPTHSFDVLSGSITFNEGAYLIQSNDEAVNYGNATFKRNAAFYGYDTKFWSSPVSGQKILKASPTDNAGFIHNPSSVFNYNESGRNWLRTQDSNFAPTKGYAIQLGANYPFMGQGQETPFDGIFTGVPNNGEFRVQVTKSNLGDNGMGNPYGSPISMHDFMYANSSIKALYFWNEEAHYVPGYSPARYEGQTWFSYNLTGSNLDAKDHIGPGVGFIARVSEDSEIVFNNSMRDDVSSSMVLNRNATQKDRFWLSLNSDNKKENQILIGYVEGATNGIDDKYDAKNLSNANSFILSHSNNNAMIIEGRQYPLDVNDQIPLYFRAKNSGDYTIKLEKAEGIFSSQPIYLIDNELNLSINLSEVSEYTFDTVIGDFATRFEIRYQPKETLNTSEFNHVNDLIIYTKDKTKYVFSKENVTAYSIYNLAGQRVSVNKINHLKEFNLEDLTSGTYIIKFNVEGGKVITKQILY